MKDKISKIISEDYDTLFSIYTTDRVINEELRSARVIFTVDYSKYKKDKKAYNIAIKEHTEAFFKYLKENKKSEGNLYNFKNQVLVKDLIENCFLISDNENIVGVNVLLQYKPQLSISKFSKAVSRKICRMATDLPEDVDLYDEIVKNSKLHGEMMKESKLTQSKLDLIVIEFVSVI